ncbi:Interferon gamma receptor 1 [Gossypium arboreum]|uniref:Interferon gamma receptor 1 n=1 Tax=Gossypium arboreum TaxID=29729 RepID=A0A0B0PA15_GOSAR|nr:Interferon gamma receptor 1 [Gossypium arboreum]
MNDYVNVYPIQIKNQRNQIWIEGKLKLSTGRPVPFFIVRDHVWDVGIDMWLRVRPCLGHRHHN